MAAFFQRFFRSNHREHAWEALLGTCPDNRALESNSAGTLRRIDKPQWFSENSPGLWNADACNHPALHRRRETLTQSDVILITYPDQVQAEGRPPLSVLSEFCEKYLAGTIRHLHILPFYPSSSDDGFSVTGLPGRGSGAWNLGRYLPFGPILRVDGGCRPQSRFRSQRMVPVFPPRRTTLPGFLHRAHGFLGA